MPRRSTPDDSEPSFEQLPRGKLGGSSDEAADQRLPVRRSDGKWQASQKPKEKRKRQKGHAEGGEQSSSPRTPAQQQADIEEIAAEVESAAVKRAKIARLSAMLLEAPHKHIGLLEDLRQYAAKDASPGIQRLALLSAVAVLRDLIPAYRIRPPTEKELKVQVSQEVEKLRAYEQKLLSAYEGCVALLCRWVGWNLEAHRAAAVRGLCALVDKAYDFNGREQLVGTIVSVANSSDATLRRDACAALARLYDVDKYGEATLFAVKQTAALLKSSSFAIEPELIASWLSIELSAAAAAANQPGGGVSNKRAKKRKRDMDPVARELAAAAGERGDVARVQTQILEHIFVAFARVVKRGATSRLLPSVLRGVAKFAHQVNVELLLDLFANLRVLLNTEGALTNYDALHCVHALLQLLSGHGQVRH